MILNPPRILPLSIRSLKPLTCLNPIFSSPDKRNNSLWIPPARLINRLQKHVIQSIDLSPMFSRRPRNLIDSFKRHLLTLTRQLGANLKPQLSQPLLHSRDIGTRCGQISPRPAVVVHVYNGV